MQRNASPQRTQSTVATAKAKFFYAGVFALLRRKEELSQQKSQKKSIDKKSTPSKRWANTWFNKTNSNIISMKFIIVWLTWAIPFAKVYNSRWFDFIF